MSTARTKLPRALHLALFAIAALWTMAARIASEHSADGLTTQLHLAAFNPFLRALFFAALLLFGYSILHWIATRTGTVRSVNALPIRATVSREFATGATLGWSIALLSVVAMMLARAYLPLFWFSPRSITLTLLACITLALSTLGLELAFRGYLYQRLIDAIGVTASTIFMSALFAASVAFVPSATRLSLAATFALGVFFSLGYQRTHALWLSWGIHFAWATATAVLFGFPLAGHTEFNFAVSSEPTNPIWLTGGFFGPQAALPTLLLALLATPALYRLTRDYAWAYTHPEIIAAGHAMDIAPPAAHTAMESTITAAPAPLVQILGTTSTAASTMPIINDHLAGTKES